MAKKAIKQRNNNGKRKKGRGGNNPQNVIGKGFDKNPQNINKNGRPPKLIHHIVEELKGRGYQPVTEGQIIDAYQTLLQLDEKGVKEMEKDKSKPYFLRLVARWLGEHRGMEMLDRVMDRSFGKVLMRQQIDATVHDTPTPEGGGKDNRDELLKEVMGKLADIDKAAKANPPVKS